MHKLESLVFAKLKESKVRSLLVAISGGADSVALLTACSRVAPQLDLHIEAVNCNFHLRGEESSRDSAFTAQICEVVGVKLHALDYDVDAYISLHPEKSIEMACRELRYADFFRIMKDEGLDRVAVAHNSDDDIETLVLNLLRGSSLRGLKGMDRDNGSIIRPLLGVSRKEIEDYLHSLGMEYIVDSSNLSNEFRRNFIRLNVLPLLESRWPGTRKALSKTVNILKEESAIIEDFYNEQLQRLSPQKDTLLIYDEGIRTGTVLRFLEPFGGNAEVAEEIIRSLSKDFEERTWKLSESFEAILERDRLVVSDSQHEHTDPEIKWSRLEMNPDMMTEIKGNRDHNIIYLPCEESEYRLRPPKTGDRMAPLGMRGTRLVSDIISDARLDRSQKAMIRVLERKSDGEIIWVVGLKRSRHDLIQSSAKHCYKAQHLLNS